MSIVTLNDRGVRSVTAFGSLNTGSMIFIKKLTASSSGDLSFVNGSSDVVLDSTYKEYLFTFNNMHPQTNSVSLQFNMSSDSGSNYNITKTTTYFKTYHNEAGSASGLIYETSYDLAQSTSFQQLTENTGNENDECFVGTMSLFNPSSTTFVKHFLFKSSEYQHQDYNLSTYVSGYGNTTSAVDAIQFKMSSGNIDAGDICLYGIL